ncbi:hypothetical protein BCR33DRAFT_237536 [Rhizoclosmatium globosum]|uniref:Uncharacterized protein n=1 Tax=Rhizoclosmatium globosum TaxID=329046 RepID=A0A1Y2CB09_9FUNG|nr:hypothetical protein BCR33DRAFT_237536 [Rhizoclosmatium globosum]|eukprot:ORY44219.1 hypothetical protein BCR33DRAFT_237536 [Rhizoclosmatium globosum]
MNQCQPKQKTVAPEFQLRLAQRTHRHLCLLELECLDLACAWSESTCSSWQCPGSNQLEHVVAILALFCVLLVVKHK